MEKLFEVVGSLIPDEQKADIKAQLDGELDKLVKGKIIEIKKELSSEYDVNFFEEDIEKAYSNDNFIKKTTYNELETKYNDNNTRLEELTATNQELSRYKEQFETKEKLFNSQVHLIGNGLRLDSLELITPHIVGDVEEDLKNIKAKYPYVFETSVEKKNPFPKPNSIAKSDFEKYIESNKAK